MSVVPARQRITKVMGSPRCDRPVDESNEIDVVVSPVSGSGSTGAMCHAPVVTTGVSGLLVAGSGVSEIGVAPGSSEHAAKSRPTRTRRALLIDEPPTDVHAAAEAPHDYRPDPPASRSCAEHAGGSP